LKLEKKLIECLPNYVITQSARLDHFEEIRMRVNLPLVFSIGTKNYLTNTIVTHVDIEKTVTLLCKNSLHSFGETLKKGYIPFEDGYRIGVCGKAIVDNDTIINVCNISSINIRLPGEKIDIEGDTIKKLEPEKGALIYSVPGGGKTTFLRNIIKIYSTPPHNKRICVIDTKSEIFIKNMHQNCPIDLLDAYPKNSGIEIAVRNLSPQLIICDEIGLDDDTNILAECKNSGTGLVCTAHAKNLNELLSRKNIKTLHDIGVFGTYIGINLTGSKRTYITTKREDIKI